MENLQKKMEGTLVVAGVQVVNPHVATCRRHMEQNVIHSCELIRSFHRERCEKGESEVSLYVLCELSSCTYDNASFASDVNEVTEDALDIHGSPSFRYYSELAKSLNSYVCFGFQRRLHNNRRTVSQAVINNRGAVELVYNKKHLCSFGDCCENFFFCKEPCNDQDMYFDLKGFRIGVALCYDIRFPEHFRYLAKLGCDLVLHPSSFPLDKYSSSWSMFSQTRALENQYYVLTVNMLGNSIVTPPWIIPGKYETMQLQEAKNDFLVFEVDRQVIETVRKEVPLRKDSDLDWTL
jgi:predicted amidohydrolase